MTPQHAFRYAHLVVIVFTMAVAIGCDKPKEAPPVPPPPLVTVTKPISYPIQEYYDYNGYLDAVETVQIRARVKGLLKEILFREGDEVKKGQPLYRIDKREYEATFFKAKADIAKAEADMANQSAQILFAKADLERIKKAIAAGAGPQTDLDKGVATLAANEALLGVAKANKAAAEAVRDSAQLDLEYTEITAPIAGRISRTLVTRGNLVGQNETTLLTTIVSVDPLYVYFDVPEKEWANYKPSKKDPSDPNAADVIPVAVGVANETGYPHPGFIDFRENKVDTGTGTIRIRGLLHVDQPGMPSTPSGSRALYPGLYARVRVSAGPARPLLALPEDALMTGQEGRYVYVVGSDKIVKKRTVEVGPNVWQVPDKPGPPGSEWLLVGPPPKKDAPPVPVPVVHSVIAIKKGLEPGDAVVISGLQRARPGAPVGPELLEFQAPKAQ